MKTFSSSIVAGSTSLLLAITPLLRAEEPAPPASSLTAPDSPAPLETPTPPPQPQLRSLGRTESGVRIKLPSEHAIRVSLGDSIDTDQLGKDKPAKKARPVFNSAFLKQQGTEIPLGTQTNYQIATMNSVEEITRKSSLAVSVEGGGAWGSAAASYNRKRFSYVGNEILQANLDLKTSVANEVLDLRYENPAEVFTKDIIDKILAAKAAQDDPAALMKLRRDFRDQYGTAFVEEIEKGARYRVVFSRQIDRSKRVDEQSASFSATVNAYCNKVKASVKTAQEQIEELQKTQITTTGELEGGPSTVLVQHDLESFLKYINNTGNKGQPGESWIKAASANRSKLHALQFLLVQFRS